MTDVNQIVTQAKAHEGDSLDRICEWLSIPSVGTDPAFNDDTRRAGQWAVDRLKEAGIDACLREIGTPEAPGHPIVWAQRARYHSRHL
ncbi:MAG: hypothetical protein ACYTF7_00520 [Planctomycetota bacterium]